MGHEDEGGKGVRGMLVKALGTVGCLAGIVVTWVAMAEILQSVQDKGGSSYDKPYFMSFLVHGAYAIFFVVWALMQVVKRLLHHHRRRRAALQYSLVLNGESGNTAAAAASSPEPSRRQHTRSITSQGLDHRQARLSAAQAPCAHLPAERHHHDHHDYEEDSASHHHDWLSQLKANWLSTLLYSILVYVVVYTWYLSLSRTFVSVNTAIYNSSCVFVFCFSVIFLKEKVSLLKIFAVLCCLGGVVMLCVDGLTNDSGKENKNEVWGYVLVIVSTMFYSLYEVLFKRWGAYKEHEPADVVPEDLQSPVITGDEEAYCGHPHTLHPPPSAPQAPGRGNLWKQLRVVEHTMLFVGLLGVWTILLAWPGIIVVDKIGVEPFELPEGKSLQGILITMGLDAFFNCLLILGIVLSSPLFISVGSLLTIPASILSDWLLHGTVLPLLSYMGMLAIVVGFLLLTLSEFLHFKLGRHAADKQAGPFSHLVPSLY